MERAYSGLEESVTNYSDYFPLASCVGRGEDSSPYRSRSERIIADIFDQADIAFEYENTLHIPREYTGSGDDRTWHPDFYLRDLGLIVEYAGMPDDEAYREGMEKKKEVYDKLGLTVIWLYPGDLWDQTTDRKYGKLRDDAREHILRKIADVKSEAVEGISCDVPTNKYITVA